MRGLFKQTNPEKPLGGRYKIVSELGAGGFGQTFLAQDLHLPDHPHCVVKQLKPQRSDTDTLQMARRLFDMEARVLYLVGNHNQIPRLLAHFEDNQEFYLAQELIEGEPLSQELQGGQRWLETQVLSLLQDLLYVLAFVHEQNVIHRDIKPSNLIRRRRDGKIVLIDFGAVKQVSAQYVDRTTGLTTKTISIGTQGYTPKEQLGGNPRFSSDLYAVGMLAIQALTGIHPRHLTEDPQTGEINWRHHAVHISPELAGFLDRMVRYDFRARYSTAADALAALRNLTPAIAHSAPLPQSLSEEELGDLPTQGLPPSPPATESTD
ncbi:MAG TPA: serine/threonine-protein kinase, partial [Coleofasciculaceae cyanobacterium]